MACGYPVSLKHFKDKQKPLQFNKDGKFKILHLTDIHEICPDMDDDERRYIPVNSSLETMNVIEECLQRTNPDLVVFGGDNISGYWHEFTYDYMYETIKKIVEPIAKRNIPLAIVFGNHDAEREDTIPCLHKENQICIYSEYSNFRGCYNEEDVFGCGNCSLPILSSDGKRTAWNIWCIDSNDYIRDDDYNQLGGYAFVHDDQIAWYERKAAELKEKNGGVTVPSILFQHIPVNQEWDMIEEVTKETEGAFEDGGKYYAVKPGFITAGAMREKPCPTKTVRSQFESWKKTGDIVAAFFGHDHVNTFIAEIDGIKLIQTIGAGYHTYGMERGGRLIVLDENSREFETETLMVERITDTEIEG